jgi:hypothetical protein
VIQGNGIGATTDGTTYIVQQDGGSVLVAASDETAAFDLAWNGTADLSGNIVAGPSIGVTRPFIGQVSLPLPNFTLNVPNVAPNDFSLNDSIQFTLPPPEEEGGGCSAGPDNSANSPLPSVILIVAAALALVAIGRHKTQRQ